MSRLNLSSSSLLLLAMLAGVGCPAPPEDAQWVLQDGSGGPGAPGAPGAPGGPQGPGPGEGGPPPGGPPGPEGEAAPGAVNDVPMGGVAAAMPGAGAEAPLPLTGEQAEAPDAVAVVGAGSTPMPPGEEVPGPPSFDAGQPGTGAAGGKPGALPPGKAVGPAPPGAGTVPPGAGGAPPAGGAKGPPPKDGSGGTPPADGSGGTPPKPLPPEGSGQKARPEVTFTESGSMITLTGTISPATASDGTLRIDVLKPGTAGFPELIHSEALKRGGPFKLRVPANTGEIRIIAYFDIGEVGPQDGEDSGRAQVKVGSADIADVVLKIEKITKKD